MENGKPTISGSLESQFIIHVVSTVLWSKSNRKGMVDRWRITAFTEEMLAFLLVLIEEIIDLKVRCIIPRSHLPEKACSY